MTTTNQLELIKKSIQKRIESIDRKRLKYRNNAYRTFITVTILGALVTVLLGLNLKGYEEPIRIMSLIITAVVTILNAYNSFFSHKELWVANNSALNRFYALQFTIAFLEESGQPFDAATVNTLKDEYDQILNELNNNWLKGRMEN